MVEEILTDLFRIEIPLPNIPLKCLNSYAIRSHEKNLIVDTGLDQIESFNAMRDALKELDVNLGKTDFFITHFHADHLGLVSKLATDTSEIYFNQPEAEIIETWDGWDSLASYAIRNGFPENELRTAFHSLPGYGLSLEWVPESIPLKDDDIIRIGDYVFRCIETPGHSRGHLCLYEPFKKVLISGDHILNEITPNIQCWVDQENPLVAYLASLTKIYELEVDLVLPGHGSHFTGHKERIIELNRHHQKRCYETLLILDRGSKNAFQVASEMTWDIGYDSWDLFPMAQKWFATGEAIAHLRFLEETGMVFRKEEEQLITFSVNREQSVSRKYSGKF